VGRERPRSRGIGAVAGLRQGALSNRLAEAGRGYARRPSYVEEAPYTN